MFWNDHTTNKNGPYRVLLKRGDLVDNDRCNADGTPRTVPFKLYHPQGDELGTCPLIIWSHGYGGSQDGAGFLSRYIASYGYNLLHITHHGTDSSLWEGKPGTPWEVLRKIRISSDTILDRYRDVSFVLDNFSEWMEANPEVGQFINLRKIGMSGHSFGAITTQVALGQLAPNSAGDLVSLKDNRILTGIAYSPVPGMNHISDDLVRAERENIYQGISTPLLHMTGTDDSSPISNIPYTDRLVVFDKTAHTYKAVLVKQGGDHMVYNGTRGDLENNPLRPRHEELVKIVSLAWWDMWLKGDSSARNYLEGQRIREYLGSDASWNFETA